MSSVIASSVIRSAVQGESHGGVYIIDLVSGHHHQVIDWDDQSISWEGRGWDRGLRGIAFYNDHIYLAASDEIFVYDQNFKIVKSFRNPYLLHAHEIRVTDQNNLLITSTGFDSILVFDLETEKFIKGYQLCRGDLNVTLNVFDPNSDSGPEEIRQFHINNVFVQNDTIYTAGTMSDKLYAISNDSLSIYATIPFTTHNARPYQDGILCNDTAQDQLAFLEKSGNYIWKAKVVSYPESSLSWTHLTQDRARQAFARGLCIDNNGSIIVGSSPSTVSVYQIGQPNPVRTIQVTNDIRNSIHGLEIWPY